MRIANRLLAFIVAAAIAAVCVIVIVEVIADRSNADPLIVQWHSIRNWGRENTWAATSVKLAAVITLVVGLILLVPQLIRRRTGRLPIETDGPVEATLTRKSVAQSLRNAVNEVDTITATRVKVRRRSITVAAESASHDPELAPSLAGEVETAATQRLAALRLSDPPRIRAKVGIRRAGRV